MELVLKSGKALDLVPLRSLLNVAGAFVAEQLAEHGEDAFCNLLPFQYSLGEAIDITVWFLVDPLTWGQLTTLLHGLKLYVVDGNRPKSYDFEIHDSATLDIYTRIGWGNIGKPSAVSGSPLLGAASSAPSGSISRRFLPTTPVAPLTSGEFYRIPHSSLMLELHPKRSIDPEGIRSILLTADSWVERKVSIFGEDSLADGIFEYGTGESPYIRLIVWSVREPHMTWGQIKTVIDGLWTFLIEMDNPWYTYCQIYDGNVAEAARIGYAAIVDTQSTFVGPLIQDAPSNLTLNSTLSSTSKRALQVSPAAGLQVSNVSQPLSMYV